MTILFLHGWHSVPGGVKPSYLSQHGHRVLNPQLPDDDFDEAVRVAQSLFDGHHPDCVVGSSRGGAVAMNLESGDTPLVLLCPAWRKWGTARKVGPRAVLLHSRADDVIPFADSEELILNSGLPASVLTEVGSDHRLADPASLAAMLSACEALQTSHATPKEIEHKFLVKNDDWRRNTSKQSLIRQGYLTLDPDRTVRIRVEEDKAFITIKGRRVGAIATEFEYPIPAKHAEAMLSTMSIGSLIRKCRHEVIHAGRRWEVDEFLDDNFGLVVAELELESEDEDFPRPEWAGEEVTADPRYSNSSLVGNPFVKWGRNA